VALLTEPKPFIDYLGGARYPNLILEEHPAGWGAGFFSEEFGHAFEISQELLATGRCPWMRQQFCWAGTSHEYGDKDIPTIIRLSQAYERLALQFPKVHIALSPFCEHKLQNPDKYLDIVAKHAPHCEPVNSVYQGARSKRYRNEVHGDMVARPGDIYSQDGFSSWDRNVTKHKRDNRYASHFGLWVPQLNCKHNEADATPINERKVVPTPQQLDSLIYHKNRRGKVSLPPGWIWKSHADQHGTPTPAPRESKPVLITDKNTKVAGFTLQCKTGQSAGQLVYSGTFNDKKTGAIIGHLYRLPDYGYIAAEKAVRLQGTPVVDLCYPSGKVAGQVNPAFRWQESWR
jgi:hypothetical protein